MLDYYEIKFYLCNFFIIGALDTKQENCKEKIKNLEANKTYLDRSLKDGENSLRELVAQKKAA